MTKFAIVGLVFFFRAATNSQAVMPDFCLAALNTSDCGAAPLAVFTYYKPGSRCELELWRGCPTLNKFPDFTECSLFCIGRQWRVGDMVDSVVPIIGEHEPYRVEDKKKYQNPICVKELNTDACFETSAPVITYMPKENHCVTVTWHGCPSLNMFQTDDECEKMCVLSAGEAFRQDTHIEEVINIHPRVNDLKNLDVDENKNDNNKDVDNGDDHDEGNNNSDDENDQDGINKSNVEDKSENDDGNANGDSVEATTEPMQTDKNSNEIEIPAEPLEINTDSTLSDAVDTKFATDSTDSRKTITTSDGSDYEKVSDDEHYFTPNITEAPISKTTTQKMNRYTRKKRRHIKIKNLRVLDVDYFTPKIMNAPISNTTRQKINHNTRKKPRHIKIKNLRVFSGRRHVLDIRRDRPILNNQYFYEARA